MQRVGCWHMQCVEYSRILYIVILYNSIMWKEGPISGTGVWRHAHGESKTPGEKRFKGHRGPDAPSWREILYILYNKFDGS